MFAVSQIIERNLHRKDACNHGLWINPEKDDCWRKAATSCHSLKLVSQDYGAFTFLKQTGAEVEFKAPTPSGAYRLFIYAKDGNGHTAHANIPFFVNE